VDVLRLLGYTQDSYKNYRERITRIICGSDLAQLHPTNALIYLGVMSKHLDTAAGGSS